MAIYCSKTENNTCQYIIMYHLQAKLSIIFSLSSVQQPVTSTKSNNLSVDKHHLL